MDITHNEPFSKMTLMNKSYLQRLFGSIPRVLMSAVSLGETVYITRHCNSIIYISDTLDIEEYMDELDASDDDLPVREQTQEALEKLIDKRIHVEYNVFDLENSEGDKGFDYETRRLINKIRFEWHSGKLEFAQQYLLAKRKYNLISRPVANFLEEYMIVNSKSCPFEFRRINPISFCCSCLIVETPNRKIFCPTCEATYKNLTRKYIVCKFACIMFIEDVPVEVASLIAFATTLHL